MVSPTIYNRSDIKENISKLFTCIEVEDYGTAKNAAEQLRDALLKYYMTRGINADHFYDMFESLEFDILYATKNHFKKQIIFETLFKIIQEIKTSTKDPLIRLKEIYDDIRHISINIDKTKIPELLECFDEIGELKTELEKLGGITYNYYSSLMQRVGDCESVMLKVAQSHPSDNLFTTLQATFQGFYEAAQKVISPPVRLQVDRGEVFDAVKQGILPQEIAEATGMSEEELRNMLTQEEYSRRPQEEE